MWLARRVMTASGHAQNMSMPGNEFSTSVFPPPHPDDKTVVSFLLKDWWYSKGLLLYAVFHLAGLTN